MTTTTRFDSARRVRASTHFACFARRTRTRACTHAPSNFILEFVLKLLTLSFVLFGDYQTRRPLMQRRRDALARQHCVASLSSSWFSIDTCSWPSEQRVCMGLSPIWTCSHTTCKPRLRPSTSMPCTSISHPPPASSIDKTFRVCTTVSRRWSTFTSLVTLAAINSPSTRSARGSRRGTVSRPRWSSTLRSQSHMKTRRCESPRGSGCCFLAERFICLARIGRWSTDAAYGRCVVSSCILSCGLVP